jgi:multidrug efflux pump subunit AcrA (membrane-fusion protein)
VLLEFRQVHVCPVAKQLNSNLFGNPMDDKLEALRRPKQDGDSPQSKSAKAVYKKWIIKAGPWGLLLFAILLLTYMFGDRLLPATRVEVETVVTSSEVTEGIVSRPSGPVQRGRNPFSGSALFQASGWFEADPFPYRATALASGIVDTVEVLEGQSVEAGEAIAILIREDAELKLGMAKGNLEAARASLVSAQSDHSLSLARMESMHKEIAVAESRRQELEDLAVRAKDLGRELVSQEDIVQAGLRLNTQDQKLDALNAQLREREIDSERLAAQVQVREGQLAESETRFQEAELEFDRMVIRAPVSGIIQRLMVAPGQKKVLLADNPESATVALLFQPEHLQARIDVPIAEASRLSVGQAVLLESEFLPGQELKGHIQRITGEADLQRNTLQVKVRVDNPPAGLRPEILCRAKFLNTSVSSIASNPSSAGYVMASASVSGRLGVKVPERAIFNQSGNIASTWAVDESGRRLELRRLQLGEGASGQYFDVLDGLRPGDRVVLDPAPDLKEKLRIKY